MEGIIASYRRGRKTMTGNQVLIKVASVDNKEKAEKLVGKQVVWNAPGKAKKALKGKISAVHGRNGTVRAIFETGVPGQAVTQKVMIE
ncbi:MAG: 50S ribosomal protein L35ae [Nanoarchaeota archaeon]|nr:50S ribosomal protein L35ae [Nanoarchaeota archaeon]